MVRIGIKALLDFYSAVVADMLATCNLVNSHRCRAYVALMIFVFVTVYGYFCVTNITTVIIRVNMLTDPIVTNITQVVIIFIQARGNLHTAVVTDVFAYTCLVCSHRNQTNIAEMVFIHITMVR